jgi:hypothetical protein
MRKQQGGMTRAPSRFFTPLVVGGGAVSRLKSPQGWTSADIDMLNLEVIYLWSRYYSHFYVLKRRICQICRTARLGRKVCMLILKKNVCQKIRDSCKRLYTAVRIYDKHLKLPFLPILLRDIVMMLIKMSWLPGGIRVFSTICFFIDLSSWHKF